MPSYTSVAASLSDRIREFRSLRSFHTDNIHERIGVFVDRMREIERWIAAETSLVLEGRRVLDLGCGQHLRQARYFACRNDVDAIDYDIIARGLDLPAYLRMLRHNGPVRLGKTLVRKGLGIDRQNDRVLKEVLGVERLPPVRFRQMDARALDYPDGTFDLVFTSSVWQHLGHADLTRADGEIARVLRRGGAAFISVHLHTSESGAHDPRIFAGDRSDVPLWAHLRPEQAHLVHSNTTHNAIRLPEWRQLLERHFPGCRFQLRQYGRDRLLPELQRLRASGELADYSDDELLTVDLWMLWKKGE